MGSKTLVTSISTDQLRYAAKVSCQDIIIIIVIQFFSILLWEILYHDITHKAGHNKWKRVDRYIVLFQPSKAFLVL